MTGGGGSERIHKPKLALSANSAWGLINFRKSLLRALAAEGYELVALVPSEGADALAEFGVTVECVPMSPRGMSPLQDTLLLLRYFNAMRRIRPAAFLGFTAKPNIYGAMAAAALGVPVINNITGLGTGFLSGQTLEAVMSNLYRLGLKKSRRVLFHNVDDLELFEARGLVRPGQGQVIPGSGVDLTHFSLHPLPSEQAPTFLFIGRLLTDKGIMEFGEAASQVCEKLPASRFIVVGGWSEHPKALPRDVLESWRISGLLDLVGSVEDVRPYISDAHCVVLPSYREGLPRALLEASAMGRPLIGTDVPGCRQVIEHEINGLLCAPRSSASLAEAMLAFASLSPAQRQMMGCRARQKAEDQFGEARVSEVYISALDEIVA